MMYLYPPLNGYLNTLFHSRESYTKVIETLDFPFVKWKFRETWRQKKFCSPNLRLPNEKVQSSFAYTVPNYFVRYFKYIPISVLLNTLICLFLEICFGGLNVFVGFTVHILRNTGSEVESYLEIRYV